MELKTNRTFIVTRLTVDEPIKPVIIEFSSLEEIFDYYHPSLEINLSGIAGDTRSEVIRFGEIGDFQLGRVVTGNQFLSLLVKNCCHTSVKSAKTLKQKVLKALKVIGDSEPLNDVHLDVLRSNLKAITEQSREIEISYRTLQLFFLNLNVNALTKVTILNASREQTTDLDDPSFIESANSPWNSKLGLKDNYDRLDLRAHYSILLIPGFIKSKNVVHRWAKIAYENKLIFLTDFEDFDSIDAVLDVFEAMNIPGGEIYLSNVAMSCNYLIARPRYTWEAEDLGLPPSAAIAGKLASGVISESISGIQLPVNKELQSQVRFDLRKSELREFNKFFLNVMVQDGGIVKVLGAKTMFNGDFLALQAYPVVRTLDYISKSLQHELNCLGPLAKESDYRKKIDSFLSGFSLSVQSITKYKLTINTDEYDKSVTTHIDFQFQPINHTASIRFKLRRSSELIVCSVLDYDISYFSDYRKNISSFTFGQSQCFDYNFLSDQNEIKLERISPNNTLFVGKFTIEESVSPSVVKDLRTLKDVFTYFRPTVSLKENILDQEIKEDFTFEDLSDFARKNLIAKSRILALLTDLTLGLQSMSGQLDKVSVLSDILKSKRLKKDYLHAVDTFLVIIDYNEGARKLIEDSLKPLKKIGGFKLLEITIDGIVVLNPGSQFFDDLLQQGVVKNLTKLKIYLQAWKFLLETSSSMANLTENFIELSNKVANDIASHLENIRVATVETEQAYRSLDLFYANTGFGSLKNISFLNASLQQLSEKESNALTKIQDEIRWSFDRLDLRGHYALLVIPGFIKSESTLMELKILGEKNLVTLFTDFKNDFEQVRDLISDFERWVFPRNEAYQSSCCLTANWFIINSEYTFNNIKTTVVDTNPLTYQYRFPESPHQKKIDRVQAPSSPALAGLMYAIMEKPAMSYTFSFPFLVIEVETQICRKEARILEERQIPAFFQELNEIHFTRRFTLYNGNNEMRSDVFLMMTTNHIIAQLIDLFNKIAYENFAPQKLLPKINNVLSALLNQVIIFADLKIKKFENDFEVKDWLLFHLELTPLFPSDKFILYLEGLRKEGGFKWKWEVVRIA